MGAVASVGPLCPVQVSPTPASQQALPDAGHWAGQILPWLQGAAFT